MSLDKLYVVASLTSDDFQLVDESGEPIFVPRSLFDVLDDWTPDDWIEELDEPEGWYWRGPPQCAKRGFFERWHDGWTHERKVFAEVFMQLWRHHEKQLAGQELVLKRW